MLALSKILVALMFSAVTGAAFAQADPPVDCKKTPDHPKCEKK